MSEVKSIVLTLAVGLLFFAICGGLYACAKGSHNTDNVEQTSSDEEAEYLFSDMRIPNSGYQFELQFISITGRPKYLYFNKSERSKSLVGYDYHGNIYTTMYLGDGGQDRIRIQGGACHITVGDKVIVTTSFYLESL